MQRPAVLLLPLAFSLFPVSVLLAQSADTVVSDSTDQTAMAVTVYNNDLGLVKDTRRLDLSAGATQLQFTEIAETVRPQTVHIRSLDPDLVMEVLEQNYEYDLLNPDKLLEKYVGRTVRLLRDNAYQGTTETVDATLLSLNGGPIFRVGDEIHVGLTGRYVLPGIPENLIARPTLVWDLLAKRAGSRQVEASYLAGGLSWNADYVMVSDANDEKVDLKAWVTVQNSSGATYRDATLKLVAGDVHQAEPEFSKRTMAMEARAGARPFEEEAFFEYHLYTLDRKTTLKDRQTKQISLLTATGVRVEKKLVYRTGADRVGVFLEFLNTEENSLGMPLPKGVVRVYKADDGGSLQFAGEDRIQHTPRNEQVRLQLGKAFDVIGETKLVEDKRISPRVRELEWEIKLRNRKDETVSVLITDSRSGDWEVLQTTIPYKIEYQELRFELSLEPDEEKSFRYRVRTRN